jgi:purine-binding chemotaxis protein CheW
MTTATLDQALDATVASRQFSTFRLGDLAFGVEVLAVQELIRYHDMTPVPLAPYVVQGLINLRGQIVTAIDMRRRLKLAPRGGDTPPMNVVVRTSDGVVSLLVDDIGDVVEVVQADFEPAPETLDGAARELVSGVYKLKDRLLLALDVERATVIEHDPGGERRG